MATIEYRDPDHDESDLVLGVSQDGFRPTRDLIGISFFVFHLAVCGYILLGWLIPSAAALFFYLAFLPLIAMQWQVNRGSCVIDNVETLVRTGRWRDPRRAAEGRFLSVVLFLALGFRARPQHLDALSYCGLLVLWVLAFRHLSVLGEPALLSLFP